MSEPVGIVARSLAEHQRDWHAETKPRCTCKVSIWWTEEHQASAVVSELSKAGFSIVPTQLLAELLDPDDCWFDHHGGCQAHGYIDLEAGQTCPVHDAKQIVAAAVDVSGQ